MPKNIKKRIAQIEKLITPSEIEIFDAILDVEKDLEYIDSEVKGVKTVVNDIQATIDEVQKSEGKAGKDGKDGINAKPIDENKLIAKIMSKASQYVNTSAQSVNVDDIIEEVKGSLPKIQNGRDGKDGSPDTPEQVRMKLSSLQGEERLDASAIKNLPWKVKDGIGKDGYPYRWPQPAGAMTYRLNGAQVGRGNILNIVGSGIIATPLDDGITYNISGGGGGAGNPSAPDTSVQFNNAGSFGGSADFTYDVATGVFNLEHSFAAGETATFLQSNDILSLGVFGNFFRYVAPGGESLLLVGNASAAGFPTDHFIIISNTSTLNDNTELTLIDTTTGAGTLAFSTSGGDTASVKAAYNNANISWNPNTGDKFAIMVDNSGLSYLRNTATEYIFPLTDGTAGQVIVTDGAGNLSFQSGSTTPGAPDTSVQFNDGGSFGGDFDFTWNKTNNTLTVNTIDIFRPVATSMVIGEGAGSTLGDGSCTFIGYHAGRSQTNSGNVNNTYIGAQAGELIDDSPNVFIGALVGRQAINGAHNVLVGYVVGGNSADLGGGNTIVGSQAAGVNTGDQNSFYGMNSGSSNTSGGNNLFAGFNSGITNITGSRLVLLGATADVASSALEDSIAIGFGAIVTANNQMVIGANSHKITDIYIGNGVTNTGPSGFLFGATGGSGSNKTGGDVTIHGGISTGNVIGGYTYIAATEAGSSGSSQNFLSNWAKFGFGTAIIGDVDNVNNGTYIIADDVNSQTIFVGTYSGDSNAQFFKASFGAGIAEMGDIAGSVNGTKIVVDDGTQLVKITNVPSFADDTAATVGGLTTGHIYKTTVLGSTFLKIVP